MAVGGTVFQTPTGPVISPSASLGVAFPPSPAGAGVKVTTVKEVLDLIVSSQQLLEGFPSP